MYQLLSFPMVTREAGISKAQYHLTLGVCVCVGGGRRREREGREQRERGARLGHYKVVWER